MDGFSERDARHRPLHSALDDIAALPGHARSLQDELSTRSYGRIADRAGHNVGEHRAGLAIVNEGADPPQQRRRSLSTAKRARHAAGDPTGVVMAARTGHEQCATRKICDRSKEWQLRANGEPERAGAGGCRWRMGS
jgi:hypothetical protein